MTEFDRDEQLQRATEAHQEGNLDQAESLFLEVLRRDPKDLAALLSLASVSFDRRNFPAAKSHAEKALEFDSSISIAHVLLSRSALATGDFESSISHAISAHQLEPENPQLQADFVMLARQRYWTYRPEEFQELFELAAKSELPVSSLPRFAHQSFAKLLRPQLIQMICDRSGEENEAPVLQRFRELLDPDTARDFDVVVTNMLKASAALRSNPRYQGFSAKVALRDGNSYDLQGCEDVDPFTSALLEVVDSQGNVHFLPFSELRRVEFGPVHLSIPVSSTTLEDIEIQGFTPALYALTQFADDADLQSGSRTVLRALTEEFRVPLGMRLYAIEGNILPMANIMHFEITS